MRLNIRIFRIIIHSLVNRREKPEDAGISIQKFRVWPSDCILKYMANAQYHAILDCGRIELFLRYIRRSDIIRHRLKPFVYSVDILHSRPLKVFSKFFLVTHIVDWDKKFFWLEHLFVQNDEVMTIAISKNAIKSAGQTIPPQYLITALAKTFESIDYKKDFGSPINSMHNALKSRTKEINTHFSYDESIS